PRHPPRADHERRSLLARRGRLPGGVRIRAGGAGQQLHVCGERHAGVDGEADQGPAGAARETDGAGAPAHGSVRGAPLMAAPKILTADWDKPESWRFDVYRGGGGYQALPKALKMQPQQVVDEVLKSNLRGRGGAGFPTGMKWNFVRKETSFPKYLVVNGDEGEPGTFKDRAILEKSPHMMVEGQAIACYALDCHTSYVYCRGEFRKTAAARVQQAIDEADRPGDLGKKHLGPGVDPDTPREV